MDAITLTLNPGDRLTLSTTIERLIGLLDGMEADPDIESNGDAEPWLGASERHPEPSRLKERKSDSAMHSQETWASGDAADQEDACEDEGAQCDDEGAHDTDVELSLGWENEGSQEEYSGGLNGDHEANLGTTEEFDQVRRLETALGYVAAGEAEPDLGWAETHGRGIVGDQNCIDDREHDDERQPNGDEADFDGGECDAAIPMPGSGSVCQYEDGWRPASGSAVAPVKSEKLTPPVDDAAQSIIRERDAVRGRRAAKRPSNEDERFGIRVTSDLLPELRLPRAGGIPQLRASDFDRLPWAD